MSGPFLPAANVNLSSGQILFADPTQPWTPDNFPNLPSTLLGFTAVSGSPSGNISTLSFTTGRVYEPYEPIAIQNSLQKTFQLDASGVVTYQESRVGFVDSFSGAFSTPITAFTPSTIGGANINDVTQTPDTITNALGKLDAWITNAFLLQPPAVNVVEHERTSLYAGVRWINFPTYSILDKFVPYVTSILFIVGDPATPNYCTFELSDCKYFPYKTYTDGISPHFTPLVRFRVFTDFFPTYADQLYSKAAFQTKCIRLISESGTAVFPDTGKVMAFDNTDGSSTYTTMSIYLPNLATSYPKNSNIPIKIVYLNHTVPQPNITYASSIINTIGGPSAPQTITQISASATQMDILVVDPLYSDKLATVTEPYFSSYTAKYTLTAMNTAYDTTGFRYGIPNTLTIPAFATSYSNVTYTQKLPYLCSTQTVRVRGSSEYPLFPGMVWSTSMTATNSAHLVGDEGSGILSRTGFPITNTMGISNAPLSNTSVTQTRYASASSINTPVYDIDGWRTGDLISTDIVFLSTTSELAFQLSSPCQFNDVTYPGDRSELAVASFYTADISSPPVLQLPLVMSTFADDFPLNTQLSNTDGTNSVFAYITDSQTSIGDQKYFYNAQFSAKQALNTISMTPEAVQLEFVNNYIDPLTGPQTQTQSSLHYVFQTEPVDVTSTTGIVFQNVVTDAQQVSGIYTPTTSSLFYFDVLGSNFGQNVVSSCFASAYLMKNSQFIGPQSNYTSNVHIFNGGTEITALPFPINTELTMSSVTLRLNPDVYQIHDDPKEIILAAKFQPAAPQTAPNVFYSSLTSTMFIDTVSMNTYSTFSNTLGPNGLRVLSLLPREEDPGTQYNMNDGVDDFGNIGTGLNVNVSSFFSVTYDNEFNISTSVYYNHTSSLQEVYTNPYSRELLYTKGTYIHPAGYNFSQFNSALIGQSGATYPDFTYDLVNDDNFGFRYASFAYESPIYSEPTAFQHMYIKVKNPSAVGTVDDNRATNTFFPSDLVQPYFISSMKVRMHAKVFGLYNAGIDIVEESSWVNGFAAVDETMFNDSIYDVAACHGASTFGADIEYKVQFNRRFYTKMGSVVRIGISQDGSAYSGDPITFDAVQIRWSD